MALFGFLRRRRHERAGFELYGAAVRAAREPVLYTMVGVPDTLDGRFDVIGLYAYLVIRRVQQIQPQGRALAQAVFDAMFSDMDHNLREIGVGDLSVGKRVRAMWEAFHGRAVAYEGALADEDRAALAAALLRNVWRGESELGDAMALARLVGWQAGHLAAQPDAALLAGVADFRPASDLLVSPEGA